MKKLFVILLVSILLSIAITGSVCSVDLDGNEKAIYHLPMQGDFRSIYMYWTTIAVGTPPLNFTVTVDTGSSDLIVPQAGCQGCFAGDPSKYYNETNSETSEQVHCDDTHFKCKTCIKDQCGTDVNYGGSIIERQVLFVDNIEIPIYHHSPKPVNTAFGAIYNVSFNPPSLNVNAKVRPNRRSEVDAYIRSRADSGGPPAMPEGMCGFGYPSLVDSHATPLFDALVKNGEVDDIFSHCLTDQGGMLVLGGVGDYFSGDIAYTPLGDETFYNVHMEDLLVNGKSIGVAEKVYNKKYCIVDSGTPGPTFPQEVITALASTLNALCDAGAKLHGICDAAAGKTLLDQVCFNYTDEQIAEMPTLTWVMKDGLQLNWESADYLQPQFYCNNEGERGLYISAPGDDFTVLGAELLQSFHSVYDRKSKRMGFGKVKDCPSFV